MNTQLLKEGLLWGTTLWLIGYVLGFIFFAFVPTSLIGWIIMPIGIVITVWVLLKYIKGSSLVYYVALGGIWTLIAVVLDYVLLVQLLKPADGYYKLDVYVYYALTFALPAMVYWFKPEIANR
jgi:hypothetical protein